METMLVIAQIFRGACILIAPFCIILCINLMRHKALTRHRRILYAGSAFLISTAAYYQIQRWDDPPSVGLFLATPGLILVFIGF